MKKYVFLFSFCVLFAVSFFISFNKTNAYVLMCQYNGMINYEESWSGSITEGSQEYSDLILSMEDDHYTAQFYIPDTTSVNFMYSTYAHAYQQQDSNGNWPVKFDFNRTLSSALPQNSFGIIDKAFSVKWSSDAVKKNLKENGICPSYVSYVREQSGLTVSYSFVFGSPQGDSVESYYNNKNNSSHHPSSINFYPVKGKTGNSNYFPKDSQGHIITNVFNGDAKSAIESYAESCLTDTYKLAYLSDVFNFNVQGFMLSPNAVEKGTLTNMYVKNGYDSLAQKIISNYGASSSCYKNNPSLKSEYDTLVTAAKSFLSGIGKISPDDEVDSCEQIIGSGSFAGYLNQALRFIQFVGPILVIALTTFEYIKVVAMSDADLLKKTNKRTIIRLVTALLLFLIPVLLRFILNIFGFYGNCLDSIL